MTPIKQYKRQTTSHENSFSMSLSEHINGLFPPSYLISVGKNSTNATPTINFLLILLIKGNIILGNSYMRRKSGTASTPNGYLGYNLQVGEGYNPQSS